MYGPVSKVVTAHGPRPSGGSRPVGVRSTPPDPRSAPRLAVASPRRRHRPTRDAGDAKRQTRRDPAPRTRHGESHATACRASGHGSHESRSARPAARTTNRACTIPCVQAVLIFSTCKNITRDADDTPDHTTHEGQASAVTTTRQRAVGVVPRDQTPQHQARPSAFAARTS